MSGYQPLYVRGMQSGLVQDRQEFILPDDAYPTLLNMFIWREQIRRREGLEFIGRLRRSVTVNGNSLTAGSINLKTTFYSGQTNGQVVPTTISMMT